MHLSALAYWTRKSPDDNAWRPQPGQNPVVYRDNLPEILHHVDIGAAIVDVAPLVAGVGAAAHASQIFAFGFTAPASVFRNARTLTAVHRGVLLGAPVVALCQVAGVEYRDYIPRWANERERRRDEEEVRRHVDVGMAVGAVGWLGRLALRVGGRYWAPIEVVMGGGLADWMHREYGRAHNF